jgi:hypothetical protein
MQQEMMARVPTRCKAAVIQVLVQPQEVSLHSMTKSCKNDFRDLYAMELQIFLLSRDDPH